MYRIAITTFTMASLLIAAGVRAEPTPEKVDAAITKAKKYIYSLQAADGTWETVPRPPGVLKPTGEPTAGQWGGGTALATYALLVTGEKPNDAKLAKAIEFLQKADITGTYAVAIKCQVWLNLPQTPEVKAAIRRDAQQLRTLAKSVRGLTVWDYGPSTRKNVYSLSRSQYAALGLWAASEMGVEQPPDIWRAIEQTWEQTQTPEGGWKYMASADIRGPGYSATTVSMTAAALATLYIAQDFTKSSIYAAGRGNPRSEPIERGFKWMIANFAERVAPKGTWPDRENPYTQLYGIERVGLASGLRRFGDFDWYATGADWLLAQQKSTGGWTGSSGNQTGLATACFSTLFLQRGRTPVAFNKLDYSAAIDDAKKAMWNQRPRDIANITRWLSRGLERELRWQVVTTDDKTALLEAPVLYLAGAGEIKFTDPAKVALKTYAQSGGMIVAHADNADAAFTRSIVELGKELFGDKTGGAEWRDLPESNPILSNQNYKVATMKTKPVLRGISNGVRELIVLMPTGDPAKAWQLRNTNARQESWQIMADVLSYATDKTTFYARGRNWLVPESKAATKKTMTVGRLKYNGNFDPEPMAFTQLGRYTLTASGTAIKTQIVEAGSPVDPTIKLLYVTGTTAFSLADADRGALKAYVDGGGTLLFEAAGGNGEFAASAQSELTKMFGADQLKTLPPTHAIYGPKFAAEYRTYKITSIANPTVPQLAGVEQGGRVVALLSREDISAGLLGMPVDGIIGYKPASARELMAKIVASLK